MTKRSFGLKAVALAVAILGFAVAESAAQCSHTPQIVVSNAGLGPWTANYAFTGAEPNTIDSLGATCLTGTNEPETVFEFTAPASGSYLFDTEGSTLGAADTQMWIFTNCSDPVGTTVGCDDDGGTGFLSSTVATLVGGTTYFVSIEPWDATPTGTAVLNIASANAPANDLCAGATPLTLGFLETVNLSLCNDEGLDNSSSVGQFGGSGRDVFYTFTPGATGNFVFFALNDDTGIAYFTGSCGALTEVAAQDGGVSERTIWNLTAGTAYTLMAEGYDAAQTGIITVGFNTASAAPSTGADTCQTATEITASPFSESVDMSNNLNWLNWSGVNGPGDQIYRFTAPAPGGYTFTASPTTVGFDAMMIGLTDNCTTLAQFPGNPSADVNGAFNGTPGSGDESFEATMIGGDVIKVYVQDFNFFGGTMDFSVAGTSTVADWSMF